MALSMPLPIPLHTSVPKVILAGRKLPPSSRIRSYASSQVQSMSTVEMSDQTIARRSADYQPPIWSFEFIQSLKTEFVGEAYSRRRDKLKEDVRVMLQKEVNDEDQLELIDNLQRLGLSYHFEDEVKKNLDRIYNKNHGNYGHKKDSLYAIALEFRILRQHGYNVTQEIFNGFRDESGNFKACLGEDYKGMLYLYEASFHSMEGESILDAAKAFATKHLKEYIKVNQGKDIHLSTLVSHALELPLHWRMLRMEARWFIEVYQQSPLVNPILLDLAKLDFNLVQATHQEDLKHASRWWKRTGLGEKLGFIRDRLVENFLWPIGELYEPYYGYYRRMATQVNTLITTIDDIYDVYGTLDELVLFTEAVERWDINRIENLPDYMKLCFFQLHNSINQMAADIFREQGLDILPYSRKVWTDLCKTYLLEVKWYHSGYTPTLQEYLDNAVVSIGAPIILHYAYALVSNQITREGLECFEREYPNVIHCSSLLLRLANDLGTSPDEMKRGDVPKSIQCYMNETRVSNEDAREYIWYLIEITWKKLNKERLEISSLPLTLIGTAMNLARMAQFMYLYGDGHSSQDQVTRNRILSLVVNPVS
ncbi:hypothetical protein SLEP1_g7728 [Rubroshorea leprosula]|uniref:(+)-delta-cadinene synthase n=1 Tax=Rubroshorea leprosula TaxID=152421 RepID=A0AAV5I8L5_9ROSI|nr:hypothetical protein SLEP1_g7728 [Rubroshorea leprosula]